MDRSQNTKNCLKSEFTIFIEHGVQLCTKHEYVKRASWRKKMKWRLMEYCGGSIVLNRQCIIIITIIVISIARTMDTARTKWTESHWKMCYSYICRYIFHRMGKSNVQRNLHYDGKYTPVVFFSSICLFVSFGWVEFVWMRRTKTKHANIKSYTAFDDHMIHTSDAYGYKKEE